MGFIDKPHRCNVPLTAHGSVAKVGAWFECERCHKEWKIQARVPDTTTESMYKLTWFHSQADFGDTISWVDYI